MGSVTPIPVPGEGYVRIEVNWQDFPHTRKCWIYRVVGGVAVRLREGNAVPMSNGVAVAFDHEAPLDTSIHYRSSIAMNANGDMEEGVSDWTDTTNTGTVGTVTQSRDYYVVGEGLASLKLVPSGAATSKAVSEFIPATAGVNYTILGRLMVPDYWSGGIGVQIQWYNGTTPNGTTGAANDFAPFPGNWDVYGFSAVAPAGTTQMKAVAAITGSAPATLPMYVDEIYVTRSDFTTTADATIDVTVPSYGGGWWTDPLHPATKVRLLVELDTPTRPCNGPAGVVYLGVGDEEFPADSSLLEVNDSPYPVGTWNRRKSGRQAISVATQTMDDLARVKALHDPGAPLLLQLLQTYREADAYALYGSVTVGRVSGDQAVDWRIVQSSFGKVAAPVGPAEGTFKTRYMDLNRAPTFLTVLALGGGANDTFSSRTVVNDWGNAEQPANMPWTQNGGVAADFQVAGGVGTHRMSAVNSSRWSILAPLVITNGRMIASVSTDVLAAGGSHFPAIALRFIDISNCYLARLDFAVGGAIALTIRKRVTGTETQIATFATALTHVANTRFTVMFEVTGGSNATVRAKAWAAGTVEPQAYQIDTTHNEPALAGAGSAAVRSILSAANTNPLPVTASWDDVYVINLDAAPTWLDALQGELA